MRLRQVLINLVSNAVKFTESGTIAIAVASVGPGQARFSVSDTGIGVDQSAQATLLDPFAQADSSTTRRFGGTGLGLAICAQLVELMGGRLEFDSRLGKGSVFWFDIALVAARGVRRQPTAPAEADGSPDVTRPGARILLADDADINQIVGVALLERLGYRVDIVSNGAEALAAVQQTRYDAVLMDCLMPVMDGYEATARIRTLDGAARRTPIIAITASAMVGDREKCLAVGMNDYVSKPLDPTALAGALARCRPRHNPTRVEPKLLTNGAKRDGDGGGRDDGIDAGRDGGGRDDGIDAGSDGGSDDGIDAEIVEGLRKLELTIGSVAYATVCATFVRTCPTQVGELNDAVAAGDVATVRRLAHKLKGGMASFGAVRLSQLAATLEITEHSTDQLGVLAAELVRECARVEDILRRSVSSN
jgi:CheY-like chemotaxis protein